MHLFVIACLALSVASEVYTSKLDHLSRTYKDSTPLFESQKNTPQKYKDVILYLRPSELKALKENNVLEVLNNQLYAKNLDDNQLSLLRAQPELRKPAQELTPLANYKEVNIPLNYPFDLIPVNNNGKQLEDMDKKQIEEIKKQIDEGLRKYFAIQDIWRPVAGKQHAQITSQHFNALPKAPETGADSLLQLRQTLYSYNIRNLMSFPDYYRLQQELEQIVKNSNNGKVAKASELSLKDDVIAAENYESLKKQPSA